MLLSEIASVAPGLVSSGRGAGARPGPWLVSVISVGDIEDDQMPHRALPKVGIEHSVSTEKHLLRPYDVLVTARSTVAKAALVPPSVSRTVANSTLLVLRPTHREWGAILWATLTSRSGRAKLEREMRGSSLPSLSATTLAALEVVLPSGQKAHRLAALVEESERAYEAGIRAARLRRDFVRDAIVCSANLRQEKTR